jgi:hypothetical protein
MTQKRRSCVCTAGLGAQLMRFSVRHVEGREVSHDTKFVLLAAHWSRAVTVVGAAPAVSAAASASWMTALAAGRPPMILS